MTWNLSRRDGSPSPKRLRERGRKRRERSGHLDRDPFMSWSTDWRRRTGVTRLEAAACVVYHSTATLKPAPKTKRKKKVFGLTFTAIGIMSSTLYVDYKLFSYISCKIFYLQAHVFVILTSFFKTLYTYKIYNYYKISKKNVILYFSYGTLHASSLCKFTDGGMLQHILWLLMNYWNFTMVLYLDQLRKYISHYLFFDWEK